MKVIIDRFEGEYAVVELESKQFVNMPKKLIPKEAAEGTVLSISIDEKETQNRKKRVSELMGELFKD